MANYTAVDDSSVHFQATTYTGAGTNTTVTNGGNSDLKPDLLWIKNRGAGYGSMLLNSSVGISYAQATDFKNADTNPPYMESSSNATENNNQKWIASVNTDGFTSGISEHSHSNTNSTYIAWQWKANAGTTSTNSDGDIDTKVQVNQTAGFSIVTYSPPNATARTIGHGLGAVPKLIIIRARNRTEDWHWFHHSAGTGGWRGNHQEAHNDNSVLGDALPTSTVYKLGTDFRMNGGFNYVGYFFAEVQGFSKFGAYIGNAVNGGGPFVYTGFKPALIIIKEEAGTEPWVMYDTARNPHNLTNKKLSQANVAAENGLAQLGDGSGVHNTIDIVSNGFKMRSNNGPTNGNGARFCYMAWAESPFVTSTGVPTTAR